jgi:hypothetical protein
VRTRNASCPVELQAAVIFNLIRQMSALFQLKTALCVQSNSLASQAEKRQRSFDKVIDDWKRKVADLQAEVERSQRESRANAAEVYKLQRSTRGNCRHNRIRPPREQEPHRFVMQSVDKNRI